MIELYTFTTPNGRKISIALEELGLPYKAHVVNITQGEQFKPEFLAINPNNKIPAIVDPQGPDGKPISVFESGAILLYLAEKTVKLLPGTPRGRSEAVQWLMFQMGGVGPMMGQLNHFARFAPEKIPYAIERYTKETERLLGVLDKHLAQREFLAPEYSVADIATYPWVAGTAHSFPDLMKPVSHVRRWLDAVGARPAVQRGMKVPELK
ncbi:glutathione S-transferase N-terminal domain-containing protein [Vitiosangium sp. GDMCC 1.1324]|uniref:glutathione S-transferase N-terminal domain-containing protein n=1 Tax=Vitiosangium sp. (strain GDMCC 1.1324) TaxID=2138576 RepID=UPI000D3D47CA|nr:glutathione S-transferase N-terminal domain-containing protein [Vitiosangium sp. GDMCC 1.1324]PTL81685.1 glutathione S-transferase [Vitiosangium sp. GDMCC 1.1324]